MYVWLPRLPVAGAHVTPLGGGRRWAVTVTSLAGGQPAWTVTGPLFDLFALPVLSCSESLVMLMLDLNVFRRRQPTG